MSDDETNSTIETIRLYSKDIQTTSSKITTLKEQAQEELEDTSEYDEVVKAQQELVEAKKKLKVALLSNGRYNTLLEELGQHKLQLKDQKHILSDHLVAYFAITGERQVEITDGDAREVLLSGKLGKDQGYQESLFRSGHE